MFIEANSVRINRGSWAGEAKAAFATVQILFQLHSEHMPHLEHNPAEGQDGAASDPAYSQEKVLMEDGIFAVWNSLGFLPAFPISIWYYRHLDVEKQTAH